MSKTIKKFLLLTIIFILGMTTAANVFGDEYTHIDRLALQIEKKSNAILAETHHYRHTAQYRHLVSDTAEMTRLAAHIHDLVHHEASICRVESDLDELDATFHHVEELFDRTELNAAYGHGRIRGNTAHVKALLNSIEDCIHHMQEDIATIRRRQTRGYGRSNVVVSTYQNPYSNRVVTKRVVTQSYISGHQVYGGGLYGGGVYQHGYGNRGRGGHGGRGYDGHRNQRPGFTIGGGSTKIRINF